MQKLSLLHPVEHCFEEKEEVPVAIDIVSPIHRGKTNPCGTKGAISEDDQSSPSSAYGDSRSDPGVAVGGGIVLQYLWRKQPGGY